MRHECQGCGDELVRTETDYCWTCGLMGRVAPRSVAMKEGWLVLHEAAVSAFGDAKVNGLGRVRNGGTALQVDSGCVRATFAVYPGGAIFWLGADEDRYADGGDYVCHARDGASQVSRWLRATVATMQRDAAAGRKVVAS